MKVLISGSLAFDKILNFNGKFAEHILPEKIHNLNVSFMTENLSENFGGTAGNIAYNLALLDEEPMIVAAAGGSDFGPYRFWLESKGVDLSLVRIVNDKPTAFATIMTDLGDNQITAIYPGALAEPCDLKDEAIPATPIAVVAAGNVADMRRMIALHRSRGVPFVFDPGQQTPALSADDLRNGITGSNLFIVNDYEMQLVVEKTGWNEDQILEATEALVVTFGEKGSRIRTKKHSYDIPAAKVKEVKDPTGAGDAYRAGFVKGLLKGWPVEVIGKFAGVVAAFAIEGVGPQYHRFSFHEVMARYTENFGEELPA